MANKYNINKRKQYIDLFKNDNLEYVVDLTTFSVYVGNTDTRVTSKDGTKIGNILTHSTEYRFFARELLLLRCKLNSAFNSASQQRRDLSVFI